MRPYQLDHRCTNPPPGTNQPSVGPRRAGPSLDEESDAPHPRPPPNPPAQGETTERLAPPSPLLLLLRMPLCSSQPPTRPGTGRPPPGETPTTDRTTPEGTTGPRRPRARPLRTPTACSPHPAAPRTRPPHRIHPAVLAAPRTNPARPSANVPPTSTRTGNPRTGIRAPDPRHPRDHFTARAPPGQRSLERR